MLEEYRKFTDAFNNMCDILPYFKYNYVIKLLPGKTAVSIPIYDLLWKELGILKDHIRISTKGG